MSTIWLGDIYPTDFHFPLRMLDFEFDRLNNISWLIGPDYKVRLTDASSGFQAITPLLLVTNYLTDLVADQMTQASKRLSVEESEKLREEVRKSIENPNLSDEVKEAALAAISKKYRYSGFVNIVEEPEQNIEIRTDRLDCNSTDRRNELSSCGRSLFMSEIVVIQ